MKNSPTNSSKESLEIENASPPIKKKLVRSLSPQSKKTFQLFSSFMNNMYASINRLYFFCEHYFEEDITKLVIQKVDERLSDFKNLLVQIKTQNIVKSQLEKDQIPSSVSFSISKWNSNIDNWPQTPRTNEWVEVAVKHFNISPPVISTREKQGKSWEERVSNAEVQKQKLENIRKREIRKRTNKIRKANERLLQQQEETITSLNEKYDSVLSRREAIINQIVEKAKNEIEKIEENNVIQKLENEGKKLEYEKNMNQATKRHQELVEYKSKKAKERISSKIINNSNTLNFPKQNEKNITFIDAINQRFLPQMVFNLNPEEIPIITLPSFNEEEPKNNQSLEKLSKAIINENQNNNLIINYLKQVNEQKTFIKWGSPESKIIYEKLQLAFLSKLSNENQIIHNITKLLPNSFPFVINIGFNLVSVFLSICNMRDSLSLVKEILLLWTNILMCNFDESQVIFISQINNSSVLRYLCYLVEKLSPSDLNNELAKDIIVTIISFLSSIISFIINNKANIYHNLIELINLSLSYIYKGLFNYLFVSKTKLEFTAIILSKFIIEFHDNLDNIISEEIANNVIKVVKQFINTKQPSHEFILFIGIISRYSQKIREKCRIDDPSILSLLSNLPLIYFLHPKESNILIPTLISICYSSPDNIKYLSKKVSITVLINYLKTVPQNDKNIYSPHFRIPISELNEIKIQFESSTE